MPQKQDWDKEKAMAETLISIVNFKSADKIKKAIDSIVASIPLEISYEIAIVDNSEDETEAEALRELARKIDVVNLYVADFNMGFGAGNNLAFRKFAEQDTKYFVIMNPDIVFMNNCIGVLRSFLEKHGEFACAVPKLFTTDGEILKAYRRQPTVTDMFLRRFMPHCFKKRAAYHTMQDMDYSKPFKVPFAQGSFLMVRAEVYEEIGGFDEEFFLYMEDADLCMRLAEHGGVCYVPTAHAIHEWERGSGKDFKLFLLHFKSMVQYFRKWSGK
ncbi:MAG: glycosyltransferase family 2 protein [Lachnospiraceae bacterium]|nr:glycosyltransferase family 2 protein [Lachnospiraceae bacterium]